MRNEHNNPTERIGRILEDFDALFDWACQVSDLVEGKQIPPMPTFNEVEKEKFRRGATLDQVISTRLAVRRTRYRQSQGYNIRGRTTYDESQDKGIMQAAGRELEERRQATSDFNEGAGISDQGRKKLEELLKED